MHDETMRARHLRWKTPFVERTGTVIERQHFWGASVGAMILDISFIVVRTLRGVSYVQTDERSFHFERRRNQSIVLDRTEDRRPNSLIWMLC